MDVVVFAAILARQALDPFGVLTAIAGAAAGYRGIWAPWTIAGGVAAGLLVVQIVTAGRADLGLGPSPHAGMIVGAYVFLALTGHVAGLLCAKLRKSSATR